MLGGYIQQINMEIIRWNNKTVILDMGIMVRVFANGSEDLDTVLLNTQHYNVRIKGKVEQSRERSSALPNTLV